MAVELGSGSRVGDYLLERKLGGGSFGSVWLARHADDGSEVAIKLLTGAQATGDRAAVRAEVELLAASASSRSRHVVRVLGGGVDPVPYIIMEYIEGRDLSQVLAERGALPPAEVVPLGIAIADALQALMEAGIIHRDLKPANVLVDTQGTAKLADFGIAKIVGMETVTMTGQLPMTMAYAAPEVWDGNVSHQSDIYALGVVLYQCLVGAPPFTGNYGALYKAHTTEAPDFDRLPPETPHALRKLIRGSLEKSPAARPGDAAAVLDLLHQAAAELTAPPTAEPTHFGPWRRRAPHATQPWAWRCVHDETGEAATVEVHAFATVAEGERLRRAVEVNPSLVPFGAERILGTSRLLLRPSEAFVEAASAPVLFWVAREEQAGAPPTGEISTHRLRKSVEALSTMLVAARAVGVELSFDAPNLAVLADGSVHVRRAGLALPIADPEEAALAFFHGLPLEEDATALVERSQDLGALSMNIAGGVGAIHGVARAAEDRHAPTPSMDTGIPHQMAVGSGPERFVPVALPVAAVGYGGGGEPPVARTGLGGFWDWARRYRLPLAAGAGVLASVAVATAAFGFWGGGDPVIPTVTPTAKATRTVTKTPGKTGTPRPDGRNIFSICATQVALGQDLDGLCSGVPAPGSTGTRAVQTVAATPTPGVAQPGSPADPVVPTTAPPGATTVVPTVPSPPILPNQTAAFVPTTPPEPTHTNTPTPTSTPRSLTYGSSLVFEDFNGGVGANTNLQSPNTLQDFGGRTVAHVMPGGWLSVGDASWSDYEVRISFHMDGGETFQFDTMRSGDDTMYQAGVSPVSAWLSQWCCVNTTPVLVDSGIAQSVTVGSGSWHTIRVSSYSNVVRVSLDSRNVLSWSPSSPLSHGNILIWADTTDFYVDSVEIVQVVGN